MKKMILEYLIAQLETPEPAAAPLPRKKRGSIAVYVMGEFAGYVG